MQTLSLSTKNTMKPILGCWFAQLCVYTEDDVHTHRALHLEAVLSVILLGLDRTRLVEAAVAVVVLTMTLALNSTYL